MSPVEIAIVLTVLILSLSFHEAAHAWMANKLGDPTARQLGRLTLNPLAHIDWIGTVLFPIIGMLGPGFPLIGWAKPVPVDMRNLKSPRRDFAIVALAGPVSNLILAVGGSMVFALVPALKDSAAGTIPATFLFLFVVSNIGLAVFNLIPVPPLDGGNILAGIVPEPVAHLIDRLRPFGFFILYGLLLTGVLSRILGPLRFQIARWLLLS